MMKFKCFVISVLVAIGVATVSQAQVVQNMKNSPGAVQVAGDAAKRDAPAPAKAISDSKLETPKAEVTPTLKAEDLLKVRDLQFQQARRLIRQQQMARDYEQLQKEIDSSLAAIMTAIDDALKDVDRTKWDFNSETLKLIARPSAAPINQSPKPKAQSPN